MPKAPPQQPPYPVINPDPTVQTCLNALRFTDYLTIGGATAGSWAYGYIFGKPVRGPTAATAATIGFTFGVLYTSQAALARFLGYQENAKEVKKYGLYETQPGPSDYEGKPLGSHYYNQPINWTKN
mmetsp:Transcript_6108/g.8888  ORF Transcript_6108/g.8888 Transcript_6108/m.8888 type:complete len:126 (-) Transcript_6108:83-460(-)